MFHLIVATSQVIRALKDRKVDVSQKKFVNDTQYRADILKQASTIKDKMLQYYISCIRENQGKF